MGQRKKKVNNIDMYMKIQIFLKKFSHWWDVLKKTNLNIASPMISELTIRTEKVKQIATINYIFIKVVVAVHCNFLEQEALQSGVLKND